MTTIKNTLLLGAFVLLLCLPGLFSIPTIDRDEAHFAQASRQMLQTHHYFQIRFQNQTRFQKPPGINWFQAIAVKALSTDDSSQIGPYRLPSVLGALLSVLFCYFFSRRFLPDRSAVLGSALLASSLLLVFEAHMAVIDSALLASIMLMQGSLWVVYQSAIQRQRTHWIWALLFWFSMAVGMVLKGVTPLVGLLTIASLCLIERNASWLQGLRPLKGLCFLISFSLFCLLMLNKAEDSNYLMEMLHRDLLPKLKGGHESHGKPPLFHLAILPITFWPGSLFLWFGACYAWRNRKETAVKFLLSWILPTWLFFEFMPTKLPQYVLPCFPALALLCAADLNEVSEGTLPSRLLKILQGLWGLLSIGLLLVIAWLPYWLTTKLNTLAIVLAVAMSLLTILAVNFCWKGRYSRASMAIFLMALISYPIVFKGILPDLNPLWFTRTIADQIDQSQLSSQRPLLIAGIEEPSLVFNFNTELVQFTTGQELRNLLQSRPNRIALVESTVFHEWVEQQSGLVIINKIQGFNYSKGRWVTLFLIHN